MTSPPPSAFDPTSLRDLIRPYRKQVLIGSVLLVLSNLAATSVTQFVGRATNAFEARDGSIARTTAIFIVVAAVFGALARIGSRIFLFNTGRDIEYSLRAKMLERIHTLGPSFFHDHPAGDIMSRATNDLAQVRLLVGFGLLNVVNAVAAYAMNLPVMFMKSPWLAIAALVPYPIFILITRRFATGLFARSKATQEALGQMSDRVQQALAGVRVVRAYGLEAPEQAAFEKLSNQALEANLALARLRGAMMPILAFASAIATLIVLWFGAYLRSRGTINTGDIMAFQGQLALVAWPTIALGYIVSILQRGRASLARIADVLLAKPDVDESTAVEPDGPLLGAVEVKDLRYKVGERMLLDGVSFRLKAGESMAIVGRTGAGKSVLVQLLSRMLPTPAGAVFLDGYDVTTLPLATLRAAVCLAQQEPFLFSTTVAGNIAFGERNAQRDTINMDRVRSAATEAQILEEAERMPEGFDTVVGERGVQLSGGQKQRVALGRALLASPQMLILDDPLSAVDARTEVAILDAIERAAKDRTLVLVTHRIAAAARCAKVIVIDEGRVVEQGTHDELVNGGGLYARLAERQQLEAELEAM